MEQDWAEKGAAERAPTEGQVERYSMLKPMLESALVEMREFSKKKQDGIVNETK